MARKHEEAAPAPEPEEPATEATTEDLPPVNGAGCRTIIMTDPRNRKSAHVTVEGMLSEGDWIFLGRVHPTLAPGFARAVADEQRFHIVRSR